MIQKRNFVRLNSEIDQDDNRDPLPSTINPCKCCTRLEFLSGCSLIALSSLLPACGDSTTMSAPTETIENEPEPEPEPFVRTFLQVEVDITDLEIDEIVFVEDARAVIGRDENGLYAMTSRCTHSSCDMKSRGEITSTGLVCYCHDSTFDKIGVVLSGPATRNLSHYKLTRKDAAAVTIELGNLIDPDIRVL